MEERLRFEQLLLELSIRFVDVSPGRVDSEIERALRRVLELFAVDRCGFMRVSPDDPSWQIIYSAVAEGITPPPIRTYFPVSWFPWTYKATVENREPTTFTTFEDLPQEAGTDKETYKRWGIRSGMNIPISLDGHLDYVMGIHAVRAERVWPAEYVPRLGLVGKIFVNALERARDRAELEQRVRFETLLADLSGGFVNFPCDLVDDEINSALKSICEHLDLDSAILWQRTAGNPSCCTITHLYRPLGGPPLPERLDVQDMFPWCPEQLTAGRAIAISAGKTPPEADRDREEWRRYGVKSSLTLPLSAGGEPFIGALSFNMMRDAHSWPDAFVKRLQLVTQIIGNALGRKRSERALRESEERLSLIAASAGVGLWVLQADTGRLATEKARELFGFAPEQDVDLERILALCRPDDRGKVRRIVRQSLEARKGYLNEYRVVNPDGTIRWMSSRGRGYLSPSGIPERLMGATMEVTEHKLAEMAAAEAQSTIAALVESTDDLIWSVDAERFGLLTFNSALRDYFLNSIGLELTSGMSPTDMVRGSFTPSVAERWRQFYLRALREGPYTEEYTVCARTKILLLSFNLLKRSGEVFGISVFGRDITERKQMVERIQFAAKEWQTTFDSIPDGVMILDREYRIVNMNAATIAFLKLPPERIRDQSCHVLVHGTDEPPATCPFRVAVKKGRREGVELWDEKRHAWLDVSVTPILDEEGEVTRVIHTVKDITERRRIETEVFGQRREMLRMDRLLRMGELTASLAHELNQPLTSILSNARAAVRFLEAGTLDTGELKDILRDIADDDSRAGAIIRSLRSMVKLDEGEPELVPINRILDETVSLLNSEAIMRNIRVETDFTDPLPSVKVDKVQIQQVLINLMTNALESMPQGSQDNRKIVVETRAIDGPAVEVAVRDFGVGIDARELQKIFDPFFTTKRHGLGIGLSLCRTIVEAHGGHIRAKNNPDGGATFCFDLPAGGKR
ncbi:MAG TPA: PAS domain S-box protein [Syntrophorhabdaceae bacterium]|jgi:PAS domain S-box-containing protein